MKLNRREKIEGQEIVEAIVALGIVSVAAIGVVGLVSRTVAQSREVADQTTGAYLAAEGVEIVKNILDSCNAPGGSCTSWNSSIGPGSYAVDYSTASLLKNQDLSPCNGASLASEPQSSSCDSLPALSFDADSGLYGYSGSFPAQDSVSQTTFRRIVDVGESGNEIDVTSTVIWVSKSGAPGETSVSTSLFNWQKPW